MIRFETTPTDCPMIDEYYGYDINNQSPQLIFKVIDIDLFRGFVYYRYWPNDSHKLLDMSDSSNSAYHTAPICTLELYKVLSKE